MDHGARRNPAELRLRTVARPDKPLTELLAHLGLELPRVPKTVANAVPKNGSEKTQPVHLQDADLEK